MQTLISDVILPKRKTGPKQHAPAQLSRLNLVASDSNLCLSNKYSANDSALLLGALASACQTDFTGTVIAKFSTGTYSPSYEPILKKLGVDIIRIENYSPAEGIVLKNLPGYYSKPIKIIWQLAVDKFDNYLLNRPGKQRRDIQRSLRKSELLITKVEALTPKVFNQWYDIYEQEVAGRLRGRRAIDRDWLESKSDISAYSLISLRDPQTRELVGGAIVKEDIKSLKLTIAYAAYSNEYRSYVPGIRVFKSAMDLAHLQGFRILSHGQDSNLYGHYLALGLMEYKASLGFHPVAKDHEIIKILNPNCVKGECFFFSYVDNQKDLRATLLSDVAHSVQLPEGVQLGNFPITTRDSNLPDSTQITQLSFIPTAQESHDQQLESLSFLEKATELVTRSKRTKINFPISAKSLHPSLQHFAKIITEAHKGHYSRELFNDFHIEWVEQCRLELGGCADYSYEESSRVASYIGARQPYSDLFAVVLEFLICVNAPLRIIEDASRLDPVDLLSTCMEGLEQFSQIKRKEFTEFLRILFNVRKNDLHTNTIERSEKGPIGLSSLNLESYVDNNIEQAHDYINELYARLLRYSFNRDPIQCLEGSTISQLFLSDTIGGRAINLILAALHGEPHPEEIRDINNLETIRIKDLWSKLQALSSGSKQQITKFNGTIARVLPKSNEHKIDHISLGLRSVGCEHKPRLWGNSLDSVLNEIQQILTPDTFRLFRSYLLHRCSFDTPAERRDMRLIEPYFGVGFPSVFAADMAACAENLANFLKRANPSARYFELAAQHYSLPLSTVFDQRSELQAEYLCRKVYLNTNTQFELFGETHRLILSDLALEGDYVPLLENIYMSEEDPCNILADSVLVKLLKLTQEKPSEFLRDSEMLLIISACLDSRFSENGLIALRSLANRELSHTVFEKGVKTDLIEKIIGQQNRDSTLDQHLSSELQELLGARLLNSSAKSSNSFWLGEEFRLFFSLFRSFNMQMSSFYEAFSNYISLSKEKSKYDADAVFVQICELFADRRIQKDFADCPAALQKLHRTLMLNCSLNHFPQSGEGVYREYFRNFQWSTEGISEPSSGTLRLVLMRQIYNLDNKSVMADYLRWALPKLNSDRLDKLFLEHAQKLGLTEDRDQAELIGFISPCLLNRSFVNADSFQEFFEMLERFNPNYAALLRQSTIANPEFLIKHPWTDYGYSAEVVEKVQSFVSAQYFGPQQCEQVTRLLFSHADTPSGLFWIEKMLLAAPLSQPNELIHFIRAWLSLKPDTQKKFINGRIQELFSKEIQRLSREVSRAKEALERQQSRLMSSSEVVPEGIVKKKQIVDRQHSLFQALANARDEHQEYLATKDLFELFKTDLPLSLPAIQERNALQIFINTAFLSKLGADSPTANLTKNFISRYSDFLQSSGILASLSMFATFADKNGIELLKILLNEMASPDSRVEIWKHACFDNKERESLNMAGRFKLLANDLIQRGLSEPRTSDFIFAWSQLWKFAEVPGLPNHTVSLTHDLERWCKHGEEPIISCQRISSISGDMSRENWNHQFGACPNADGRPLARMLLPQLKLFEYRIGSKVMARALAEVTVKESSNTESEAELHLLVETLHFSTHFDKLHEFYAGIGKLASDLGIAQSCIHFSDSEEYPQPLEERYRIYRDSFRTD